MIVVVLSGPMSGQPDFNRAAFAAVASRLRAGGNHVINPGETRLQPGATWGQYMGHCLDAMRGADVAWRSGGVESGHGCPPILAQLPGWRYSPGATVESALAQLWGWGTLDIPEAWCEPMAHRYDSEQIEMFDGGEATQPD